MKDTSKSFSRRDFLKTTLASTAALAAPVSAKAAPRRKFNLNPKGLPTTILGKTGLRVPRIAIGCGSRFKTPTTDITGPIFLENALNNGFYYWDCAANYGTEHRLGPVIKERRDELVISSKVQEVSVSSARALVEQSFANFNTDYIDCYNMHAIASVDDAKAREPVYEMLLEYKNAGDIGNIGISGHASAAGMLHCIQNYDLDLLIMALDHQAPGQAFEGSAIPAAAERGMGVSIIKAIRPRENDASLTPRELIRYALSLEHVNTAIIGMGTDDVMLDNANILRTFTPMTQPEMDEMAARLQPFYEGKNVPWRQPGYFDGEGGWVA